MKTLSLALPSLKAQAAKKAEQAVLEALPVDPSRLRRVAKYLNPRDLKRIGIAVIGAGALVSLLSAVGQQRFYQAAVARELKKQLAPVNKKLDALQEQNEELKKQNEELKKQLKARA